MNFNLAMFRVSYLNASFLCLVLYLVRIHVLFMLVYIRRVLFCCFLLNGLGLFFGGGCVKRSSI